MNGSNQWIRLATVVLVLQFANSHAADCAQTLYGYARNEPDFAYLPNIHIAAVYADIPPIETISDTNGYFELCVPARNDGNLIVTGASADEFIAETLPFNMSPGNSYGVMFGLLRATNEIAGTIRTTSGQPIPNALVGANLNGSFRPFQIHARADEQGRYKLKAGRGGWVVFTDCAGINLTNFFCPQSSLVTITETDVNQDILIWPTTPANPPILTAPKQKIVNGLTRFAFTFVAEPGYYELYESETLSPPAWQMIFRFVYSDPVTDEFTRDQLIGPSRYYLVKVVAPPDP